jgi:hypothetical protein
MAVMKKETPALKPSVGKHRLAADIMVALIGKYGILRPTIQEATMMSATAYHYAEAFVREGDKQQ